MGKVELQAASSKARPAADSALSDAGRRVGFMDWAPATGLKNAGKESQLLAASFEYVKRMQDHERGASLPPPC
jgi:hypothetical protein